MLTAESAKYLTVEETATRAGVSGGTVRRAIRRGELQYRRRRGTTMLLYSVDVDDWIQRRQEVQS